MTGRRVAGVSRRSVIALMILFATIPALKLGWDRLYPKLPSDDSPIILVLGDSISAGKTLDVSLHYPAYLQSKFVADRIDVRIYNAGFPGEASDHAAARAVESLAFHPAIMIIALGTNDITGTTTAEEAENNLAAAIEAVQSRGVEVFLIGSLVQRADAARLGQFERMYHRLAERFGVPLVVDILAPVSNNPDLILKDNIHPTAAGQVAIADMLYPPLKTFVVKVLEQRRARHAQAQN